MVVCGVQLTHGSQVCLMLTSTVHIITAGSITVQNRCSRQKIYTLRVSSSSSTYAIHAVFLKTFVRLCNAQSVTNKQTHF